MLIICKHTVKHADVLVRCGCPYRVPCCQMVIFTKASHSRGMQTCSSCEALMDIAIGTSHYWFSGQYDRIPQSYACFDHGTWEIPNENFGIFHLQHSCCCCLRHWSNHKHLRRSKDLQHQQVCSTYVETHCVEFTDCKRRRAMESTSTNLDGCFSWKVTPSSGESLWTSVIVWCLTFDRCLWWTSAPEILCEHSSLLLLKKWKSPKEFAHLPFKWWGTYADMKSVVFTLFRLSVLSCDLFSNGPEDTELLRLIRDSLVGMEAMALTPPFLRSLPFPSLIKLRRVINRLRGILHEHVNTRRMRSSEPDYVGMHNSLL